jgi:hypothetical protein
VLGQGIPGEDCPDGQITFRRDANSPADPAIRHGRDADHVLEFRRQHVRRLLATDDRLQRLPDAQHVLQFRLGAQAAGAGQPGPSPGGVSKVVAWRPVDDRGAVEHGQQEVLVRYGVCHPKS